MINIKAVDKYSYETYVENNYQYLYATLKGIGDITITVCSDNIQYYDNDEEIIKEAAYDVSKVLGIYDEKMSKKIFKYFYSDVPEKLKYEYVYRQRKSSMNELANLARASQVKCYRLQDV